MKNWKRFIAACLSVTMVASIPFTAFAESSVSVKELLPKTSSKSETQEETDLEKILSQEKPYEYFSGLKDQEKLLDACKDEELFQLKEYVKYAYIHESDLKNRQSLDAYLLISEAWKNRKVTFEKEEQEQLLQFLEDTNVYGTKYKDGEKEKIVEDFPTYMEYLQSIKKFDVPRYVELLSAFDEAKTEDDLAKAMEAFSNFENSIYGFDEPKEEPQKEIAAEPKNDKTKEEHHESEIVLASKEKKESQRKVEESKFFLSTIAYDPDYYYIVDKNMLKDQLKVITPEALYTAMVWARYAYAEGVIEKQSSEEVYLIFVNAWFDLSKEERENVLKKKTELKKDAFECIEKGKVFSPNVGRKDKIDTLDKYIQYYEDYYGCSVKDLLYYASQLEISEKEFNNNKGNMIYAAEIVKEQLKKKKTSKDKDERVSGETRAAYLGESNPAFTVQMTDFNDTVGDNGKSPGINPTLDTSINSGHRFKFQYWYEDQRRSPYDYYNNDNQGFCIYGGQNWYNNYFNYSNPDSVKGKQKGIVGKTLNGGYPYIAETGESLNYLFNGSGGNGVLSSYRVDGLMVRDGTGFHTGGGKDNLQIVNASNGRGHIRHEDVANGGYRPFNALTGRTRNNWHSTSIQFKFFVPDNKKVNGSDASYYFWGDDDVWVFIDDVLVLDLGGIHGGLEGTINLTSGAVREQYSQNNGEGFLNGTIAQKFQAAGRSWNGNPGTQHTMKIFHMERGNGGSNFYMGFNIPVVGDNHQVRYNPNGGTGSMASNIVNYGKPYTIQNNGFSRSNYTFTGWNTSPDGKGTSYAPGQTINYPYKNDITLYAQWTPMKLVTTFHKNDGSTTTATQTFTYDVAGQKFSDKKWTRTGYTLLGWADSKTATTAQYSILSGVTNAWIEKHYPENDVYKKGEHEMKKKLVVIGMMVVMVLATAGCGKQECIGCGEMKKCNERNIGGETLYICDDCLEDLY